MRTLLTQAVFLAGVATIVTGASARADIEVFTAVNNYIHTAANGALIPGIHLDSTGVSGRKMFSDIFDLTADGFDPSMDTAFAGVAYFDINDFNNPSVTDQLRINIGPFANLNHAPAASYSFTFGLANLAVLEDINIDGTLDFSVISQSGTFFLTKTRLDVLALVPNAVPEGASTFRLLAVSLLGLAAFGYRMRSASRLA